MSYCECDYEPPSVYRKAQHQARKQHKCFECARLIHPGERYEVVFGIWDGSRETYKTCSRCLALREWVTAHVPCVCWAHGNVRDDAIEAARGWAHEAPGLLFGAWRREVAIRRNGSLS